MSGITHKYNSDNNVSGTSSRRPCPLCSYDGRDEQFEESSLQEHYISERHQKKLARCAQQSTENENNDSSEADTDMEAGHDLLFEEYDRLSIMTKTIESSHDEITRLNDEMYQSNTQNIALPEQLSDVQTEISLEKAHLNALSIYQNVLKQDVTTLKDEIENDNAIVKQSPDGTMVWKITRVREKLYDAQSERQTSIYSPSFYTSTFGYRVCVRLYLNGDGSARGSHMSVFIVILRGLYDSLLTWPFSYRVSFCLYDQRTIMKKNGTIQPKHVIESFRPDIDSISFKRPCSAMNIASGIPKFVLLNEVNELTEENLYVVNDTMYIKTVIDFTGMPRSILPFIFNIDIAFPVHIQQKLIADELERREGQKTN